MLGRVDAAAWGKSGWLVSWLGAGKPGRSTLYLAELDPKLKVIRQQSMLDLPAGRNIGIPRLATLHTPKGRHALLVWTQASDSKSNGASTTQVAGLHIRALD